MQLFTDLPVSGTEPLKKYIKVIYNLKSGFSIENLYIYDTIWQYYLIFSDILRKSLVVGLVGRVGLAALTNIARRQLFYLQYFFAMLYYFDKVLEQRSIKTLF